VSDQGGLQPTRLFGGGSLGDEVFHFLRVRGSQLAGELSVEPPQQGCGVGVGFRAIAPLDLEAPSLDGGQFVDMQELGVVKARALFHAAIPIFEPLRLAQKSEEALLATLSIESSREESVSDVPDIGWGYVGLREDASRLTTSLSFEHCFHKSLHEKGDRGTSQHFILAKSH
jgi:hypothetical protein